MGKKRFTVNEAAGALGTTPEAVRMRIRRGTLDSELAEGTRFVLLGPDQTMSEPEPNVQSDALTSELRDRIAFLERELDVRSEEIRRRDTIIMNMSEAMKALPAPTREPPAPDGTVEATEAPFEGSSPGPAREAPDAATQRPWWRRLFGS